MLLLILWTICGIFAYGLTLGYMRNKYMEYGKLFYWSDVEFSLEIALFGPIGLIYAYFKSEKGKYGLKFL